MQILAESVRTCEASLLVAVAEKNAAVTAGELSVEGQLQVLVDERDDLSQRIRFLERRLFRWVCKVGVCTTQERVMTACFAAAQGGVRVQDACLSGNEWLFWLAERWVPWCRGPGVGQWCF